MMLTDQHRMNLRKTLVQDVEDEIREIEKVERSLVKKMAQSTLLQQTVAPIIDLTDEIKKELRGVKDEPAKAPEASQ